MKFLILNLFFIFQVGASTNFPVEGTVKTRVDFWKKVYTEINSNRGFIHDAKDLSFIYKKIDLPSGRRARIRMVKREKQKIVNVLRSILKKKFKNLNDEEMRILSLTEDKSEEKIKSMIKWVRLQRGLKDNYYKGLIRSYKYMDYIKETFEKYNLPPELVYLPHVESSFNYKAYSKVGAAGIWQFMRATGKRFGLRVSYIIDDRRDPLKATVAAAKLLKANYEKLQSWPLALTAYNHGARSMERAVNKLGTKNIATIIDQYDGRRFGFASKNFYATFMATVEISQNPSKYFPTFKLPEKFEYSVITLDRPYQIKHLTKTLELTRNTLKEYNPAIRRVAFRTPLFLPKGLKLQIPKTTPSKVAELTKKLKNLHIPKSDLELEKLHIVSRGESLFTISRIYDVEIAKIIQFNRISDPTRIYPGMKLKIPGKKTKVAIVVPPIIAETKPKEEIKAEFKPIEKILNPIQVKEVKRKIPKAETLGERVRSFFGDLFKDEEKKKLVVLKEETKKKEELLNLSSYDLDLTFISPDIYEIVVETEETIGHYGEWAQIPTQVIRDLNGFGGRSYIQLGQKIKIKVFNEQLARFKELRNEYQLAIQEDFYEQFSLEGEEQYIVKSGDNLTQILEEFNLPYWLLRSKQPSGILKPDLKVGDILVIPKVSTTQEAPALESSEI